jgi:hypothetical protein
VGERAVPRVFGIDTGLKIPDWAREAEKRILALATRYGMSPTERKWIAWYIDTPGKGSRPKTPKPLPLPPRWWEDKAWALKLKG